MQGEDEAALVVLVTGAATMVPEGTEVIIMAEDMIIRMGVVAGNQVNFFLLLYTRPHVSTRRLMV